MNAVATKPKAKAIRAKKPLRADMVYAPNTETDLCARLETLKAALTQAEEHVESAFDAAEDGSAVEVLLEHIGHVLLADAMRPLMGERPTRDDAQHTYSELFLVTAALNGAMAMVAGTSIHTMLQEAFELLDWSQNECESQTLIDLLPEAHLAAEFARGRDFAIKMMADAEGLQDEREGLRRYRKGGAQDNIVRAFLTDVREDPTLIPGFTSVLSAALRNDHMDLAELAQITLAETQASEPGSDGTSAASDICPSTPSASAPAKALDQDEVDSELSMNEAVALNSLTGWIISARDTLEAVRLAAEISPALGKKLSEYDVRYNSPEWLSDGAGNGMAYLLMRQRSLIKSLGRGAA